MILFSPCLWLEYAAKEKSAEYSCLRLCWCYHQQT